MKWDYIAIAGVYCDNMHFLFDFFYGYIGVFLSPFLDFKTININGYTDKNIQAYKHIIITVKEEAKQKMKVNE